MNLKDAAKSYEPKQTLNIADLDKVPVEIELVDREGDKKDEKGEKTGEKYTYKAIVVEGTDYRVPYKVIGDLKEILEEKPLLKYFKVKKTGEGKKNTKYTVIPLE